MAAGARQSGGLHAHANSAPMGGSSSSVRTRRAGERVRDQNGLVSSAPFDCASAPELRSCLMYRRLLTVAILLVQPPLRTTGRPATRAGSLTLPRWPGKSRGRLPIRTRRPIDTAKDGLVDGKPVIRLGNVSRPLHIYTPAEQHGAAWGFFGRRIPHSRHRSRRHRSLRWLTSAGSPARW